MFDSSEPGGYSRRGFAHGAALGGAFWAGSAAFAEGASAGAWLDVRALGAKGDGAADDTKALQAAIDAAAGTGGGVWVPPGAYRTRELQMRRGVCLAGAAAWNYRGPGGSVLRLIDKDASCLINLTGAIGSTLDGLSLEGGQLGKQIHGIFLNKPDYGKEEDAFRIERCQVTRFTGTAVMLNRVWCFSIRHSMLGHNGGDGVRCIGWDGFVLDNWFSGNGGCGWEGTGSASVTMTGNRIEWNRQAGILVAGGNHYNITGNYLDRSGGPAVVLVDNQGRPAKQISVTGNVIYRSGKWADDGSHDSAHIRLAGARGVTVTGNTLSVGRDDGGKGKYTPAYGIVLEKLDNCVVSGNVLHDGALQQLVLDLGGHGERLVERDNPGQLFRPPA